jgi:hypothetical protein
VQKFLVLWQKASVAVLEIARFVYRVIEFGLTLAVTYVAVYVGYWLVFGPAADPRHDRMLQLVKTISDNWKAFLLLGIPLFYRTVRTFMEEVQEAGGMKRRSQPATQIPPQGPNPPTSSQ